MTEAEYDLDKMEGLFNKILVTVGIAAVGLITNLIVVIVQRL